MFNAYPYTDFHELNADWIINELKRFEAEFENLYERAVHDAVEQANAYTDSQLSDIQDAVEQLSHDFDAVLLRMAGIEGDFSDLVNRVNTLQSDLTAYINAQIAASNARTDAAIAANNQTIIAELAEFLSDITVINFFTGERVSIQEMFNYLAQLHLNDSIDYDTMYARNKTYTEFVNMNMNYTNLVMHGNTLYI